MSTKAVCSSPVAANVEDQASALWQVNDAWVYILSTCTVAQVYASQHPCVPLYCGTPVCPLVLYILGSCHGVKDSKEISVCHGMGWMLPSLRMGPGE